MFKVRRVILILPSFLKNLPITNIQPEILTFDVQCSMGTNIIIMVTGNIAIDNENKQRFSQVFQLIPTGTGSFLAGNDVFRLNYG